MPDTQLKWPSGFSAAVSFTFDDARESQVLRGIPEFDAHEVRCTFYVSFAGVEKHLSLWRAAQASGHEIGNHTLWHPCTANYPFSRAKSACLEEMSLVDTAAEIDAASHRIRELLGTEPTTFAYPCGGSHVGRGTQVRSYIPIVADRFIASRGYYHDFPNDPTYCDLHHLLSYRLDRQPVQEHVAAIEKARNEGAWAIFSGHETGGPDSDPLNVALSDLRDVLSYVDTRRDTIWVAPVSEVAAWISRQRAALPAAR